MNQDIAVTGFYFVKGNIAKSFPKRIETQEGQQINFIEEGLRCVIKKGQDLLEIFTMSDGSTQYRLGFEHTNQSWKLLGTQTLEAGA